MSRTLLLLQTLPVESALDSVASELFLFILGIVIGFVAGYAAGQRSVDGVFTNVMAVFICSVWAFSVYSGATTAGYTTPFYVHGVMGLVVGSLFAIDGETAGSIATILGRRAQGQRSPPDTDRSNNSDKKE